MCRHTSIQSSSEDLNRNPSDLLPLKFCVYTLSFASLILTSNLSRMSVIVLLILMIFSSPIMESTTLYRPLDIKPTLWLLSIPEIQKMWLVQIWKKRSKLQWIYTSEICQKYCSVQVILVVVFIIFVWPAKHSGTKGSLCPVSVRPSVSPVFTLSFMHSYVWQTTHAFLGMLSLYCVAHVGMSVSLNLVQLITQERFAPEASNLVRW